MDFWLTYESLINKHINTLVLPGFMHNSGLSAFKQKSFDIYKKAGYMLFDTEIDDDPNVASVSFRIDEASFLIAVATCQYLNENFAEYGADGLNVGFFGGVPLSSIIIYFGGFEYGIKF
jgi:basic membrane lipoprotein Med (substrate-binding protein (PBP1-ABC) superfamily)